MKFTELFTEYASRVPGEQQEQILAALPVRAKEIGVRVWKPGDPIPSHGRRLLIGVTQWSRDDLEVLDAVCEVVKGDQLDMFILGECKSQAEIEDYVPGVGPVFQSPVVGVWEDGILVDKGSGWEAKQLLARHGVLNPAPRRKSASA
jgi:hypothetical protein